MNLYPPVIGPGAWPGWPAGAWRGRRGRCCSG